MFCLFPTQTRLCDRIQTRAPARFKQHESDRGSELIGSCEWKKHYHAQDVERGALSEQTITVKATHCRRGLELILALTQHWQQHFLAHEEHFLPQANATTVITRLTWEVSARWWFCFRTSWESNGKRNELCVACCEQMWGARERAAEMLSSRPREIVDGGKLPRMNSNYSLLTGLFFR